uniref:Uncharacterized protein n=1 Tax=Aegilops tauschii TaxID=37682 RepID=M8BUE3_AEGTA
MGVVDTFGLCVVAHMMLHGEEMSIAKVPGTGDLRSLRRSFQEYMCSNYQLVVKLNQLLAKQKASLCSS